MEEEDHLPMEDTMMHQMDIINGDIAKEDIRDSGNRIILRDDNVNRNIITISNGDIPIITDKVLC